MRSLMDRNEIKENNSRLEISSAITTYMLIIHLKDSSSTADMKIYNIAKILFESIRVKLRFEKLTDVISVKLC